MTRYVTIHLSVLLLTSFHVFLLLHRHDKTKFGRLRKDPNLCACEKRLVFDVSRNQEHTVGVVTGKEIGEAGICLTFLK